MGAKEKEEEVEMDTTFWMVTFSDLLQLLLTFFVLLISMSSLDAKVVKQMFSFFPGAIGPLNLSGEGEMAPPHIKPYVISKPISSIELEQLISQSLELKLGDSTGLLAKEISITRENRGVVINFPVELLFKRGGYEINPASYPALDQLSGFLAMMKSDVEIAGYTDALPIRGGEFSSNWELSLARAVKVLEYFLSKGVEKKRLSAHGFGEYSPLFPNDSDDHRRKNRRVEIIVKQKS